VQAFDKDDNPEVAGAQGKNRQFKKNAGKVDAIPAVFSFLHATETITTTAGGKSRRSQVVLIIETPSAQSSGLATGSTALQIEIPNGLGSEFYPGAPRIYLNDEGAISPRI
jgi:hypothetical protein